MNDVLHFLLSHMSYTWIIIALAILLRVGFAILDAQRHTRRRGRRRSPRRSYRDRSQRSASASLSWPTSLPPSFSGSSLQVESPIEALFWDRWQQRNNGLVLVPQYGVGRYRLDFAHVPSKIGIELDGFVGHSSTEDIARDRRRQRELEMQGWRFIRFGGKEINQDPLHCVHETETFIQQVMTQQQHY